MDDKAQISLEYMIMLAVGLLLAGIVLVLITNLYGLKEGIKTNIHVYRERVLQAIKWQGFKMDDNAQLAFEYLVIISILIFVATMVSFLAVSIFGAKEGVKNSNSIHLDKTLEMIKWEKDSLQ